MCALCCNNRLSQGLMPHVFYMQPNKGAYQKKKVNHLMTGHDYHFILFLDVCFALFLHFYVHVFYLKNA